MKKYERSGSFGEPKMPLLYIALLWKTSCITFIFKIVGRFKRPHTAFHFNLHLSFRENQKQHFILCGEKNPRIPSSVEKNPRWQTVKVKYFIQYVKLISTLVRYQELFCWENSGRFKKKKKLVKIGWLLNRCDLRELAGPGCRTPCYIPPSDS